ncbi:MAG: LytS/YhcK type 5TM receptor domain-containing protein [Caldisericia bacterium]|nr:LytS/YhcK type 5TM receptor domain-containing protein [Caldisericia bacterium]
MFLKILFNIGTITSFGVISILISFHQKTQRKIPAIHGFFYGLGAVIGMLQPVVLKPGVIFDGRSILISIAGLFFGPIAAFVAASMAISLRLFQGGPGVWVGCLTALISAIFGTLFYVRYTYKDKQMSTFQIYLFGLWVHLGVIACFLALPRDVVKDTLVNIGPSMILMYPLATVLLGKIIALILSKKQIMKDLERSKKQLEDLNHQLDEKVRERTKDLEESNASLEAFSYSVSHDLRAPLRAIQGFSAILLEDYGSVLTEEGVHLLSIIQKNTSKMDALIKGILSISRITKSKPEKTTLKMKTIVEQCLQEIVPKEDLKRIRVHMEDLPPAWGDPVLVRQVWWNLLDNAIKFSSKKPQSTITITGTVLDSSVEYSIKDNGVGFDEAYKDKLFNLFQQLHSPDEFDGTGIGLALVKRILQKHGGTIRAKGSLHDGAEFIFTLPEE